MSLIQIMVYMRCMQCFVTTQSVASQSWAIAQDRDATDRVNAKYGVDNKPYFELNSNHGI